MKSVSLVIRRIHLYFALLCLPWFTMFGITALAFNHPTWFSTEDDLYNLNSSNWERVQTWQYALKMPEGKQVPKEVGSELLKVANVSVKAFSVGRWGADSIAVYISDVWSIRRLMYDEPTQQLTLYRHTPDWRVFFTLLHSRAGYQHDSFAHDLWALLVDLTSVGILLWVASGIYIWWQRRNLRRVGLLGLALGMTSFVALLFFL